MIARMVSLVTLGLAVLSVGSAHARAALVTGVTPSTNMLAVNGTSVVNIVNGSGLPGDVPALTGTHWYASSSNTWVSGYKAGYVIFDLGDEYYVDGMSIWPFNGNNQICVKDVQVLSSTDGSNYIPVAGAPSVFPQGPCANVVNPVHYSFPRIQATHIRFDVLDNYGYSSPSGWCYSGFAEVQFDGIPVPEPASLGLFALMGMALLRRRRSRLNIR